MNEKLQKIKNYGESIKELTTLINKGSTTNFEAKKLRHAIIETKDCLYKIVNNEFELFKSFCDEHPKLFQNFWVMRRNTDYIVDIKLKPNKNAVLVTLENGFDGCGDISFVLLPYTFIENRNEFLRLRTLYIKDCVK